MEEYAELVWRFWEMCDRYDGWPVFYEVGPENIYLYLDLGLTLLKLGEQDRFPLENFSDFMRYVHEAVHCAMDYLFISHPLGLARSLFFSPWRAL